MKSYWIRVVPKSTDWCPYKRKGHTKTQRRQVATNSETVDVSSSQGTPKMGVATRNQSRDSRQIPPRAFRRNQPYGYLDLRLLASRTRTQYVDCFKSPSLQ